MKKLAVVALPGLLVITAAMGFLSTLTRNNASHSISDASREASSRSAAAQTVAPASPNPPAPTPPAAQATTQSSPPATSPVPPALAESVTANFPGYRVPGAAEIKEAWSASDAGASPFIAQGDFNGDGRIDAALIILGASDWRLVIFEQDDQQHYAPTAVFRAKTIEELSSSGNAVIASPQQLLLATIKQGETWTPEAGDVRSEVRLKSDAIALSHRATPDIDSKLLIFFDDGKYQTQFADSLLQIR